MSLAPRPGKGHSACQEEGLALTRPLPCVWMSKLSFPIQRLKWEQRQGLRRVGRVSSTLQRMSVFFLTMDLSTPSTTPVHTQHTQHTPSAHSNPPFCLSPRKKHTSGKGKADFTGGLHGLQQTWQVSFLHREPCGLVGDKNLYWGQCLSRQVGGSPCASAGCFPSGNLEFGQKVTLDTESSLVPRPGGQNVSYVTPL